MNELLEQNYYSEKNSDYQKKDIYRPDIHFTPLFGWINDPNGFIRYKGMYHLFYQYHPYDTIWGPMHWGHAVSDDLIHWNHMPIALTPGENYDIDGCFSGSAIEKEGKLFLMYTGNVFLDDSKKVAKQTQCIASSENGCDFLKYSENPVMKNEKFTKDMSIYDFRDPKVMNWDDKYLCLVGSKTEEETGQFLLFESVDLVTWIFKSVMLKGDKAFGTMWECPNMFRINEKDVIIMSPTAMPSQGERYRNVNSSIWMIGVFDIEKGTFNVEHYGEVDHGLDFYAPQVTANENGEMVMISWMDIWDHTMPTHEMGLAWTGAMIIPRELSIRNNELIQRPVGSVNYCCKIIEEISNLCVNDYHKVISLQAGMRIKSEIRVYEDTVITIQIFRKESEHSYIIYRNKEITLQRVGSPYIEDDYRKTDVLVVNDIFDMDLILDRSALEVFFDDGRRAMSARMYPEDTSAFVQLDIEGSVNIHKLQIFLI